jgi:geranylgeranylglycerol-phosphate geranylgeranyltransferase
MNMDMDMEASTMDGGSAPLRRGAMAFAWFRLLHPFPSILVTVAASLFAELAADGHAPTDRLARLAMSVLCSQFAIGSANDVVDRGLDRQSKPWKPVAHGVISANAATVLAIVLSSLCLAVSASLSGPTLLAAGLGLGCGLSYDLWLKRSRWSWLPYGLAIPTVPVWSWAAMDKLTSDIVPAYPLGLLLGLALHLANTLPDLEDDKRFGVEGLAHGLGRRKSLALCWGAMAAAQLLTLALAPVLHYHGRLYPVGLAASVSLTAVSGILYWRRPTVSTLQLNFGILALATVALAIGWLGGAIT